MHVNIFRICTLSNDSNGDGISYLETEVSDGRWKLEDYTNSGDWAWQPISMEEFKANQPGGVMNLAGKDLVPSGQEIWRLGKCSKTVIVSNPVIKDTKVTQESRAKTDSSVEKVKKEEKTPSDWHLDMVLGGIVGALFARLSIKRRIESQKRRNEELKRATRNSYKFRIR